MSELALDDIFSSSETPNPLQIAECTFRQNIIILLPYAFVSILLLPELRHLYQSPPPSLPYFSGPQPIFCRGQLNLLWQGMETKERER